MPFIVCDELSRKTFFITLTQFKAGKRENKNVEVWGMTKTMR